MRLIILNVHYPDFMMGEGFEYAIVVADAGIVEDWLRNIRLVQKMKEEDQDVRDVTWWDYSPYFVNAMAFNEAEREKLDNEDLIVVHKKPDFLKDKGSRLDCCWLSADHDGIRWVAIPKHSDCYVDTREIPEKFLKGLT